MNYKNITNTSIRKMFMNICTIEMHISCQKLTFLCKVVCKKDDQLQKNFLTAWCNHPRKRGSVLQNNKKNIVQNIRLILPCVALDGLMTSWVYFTLESGYWNYLVSSFGNTPRQKPPPDCPEPPASVPQTPPQGRTI